MKNIHRSQLVFFVLIFIAAASLRLMYLFDFLSLPLFGQAVGPDVSEYFTEAQKIRAGEFLPREVLIHAPLYPYLLAGILAVTDGDFFLVRMIQSLLLALLTLLPVYCMLRCRAAGLSGRLRFLPELSVLFIGLYPPLVIYQCDFFSENLMLVLLLFSLWCFSLHKKFADAAAGLFCGLALLAHPGCIFFLPFGALYAAFRLFQRRQLPSERKNALLRAGSFLLAALLVIAPVCLRNSLLTHRFVMIQDNSMFNLVLGNSPEANGTCRIPPGIRWDREFEKAHREAAEQGCSVDSYYRGRFFRYVFSYPLHYLQMLLKKAAMTLSCREFTTWSDVIPLQLIVWHKYMYHNWFMLLLLLGGPALLIGVFQKPVRRFLGPELILFGAVFAGQVFFLTAGRYRLPLVVPLAVFSGYFLCATGRFLGTTRKTAFVLIIMAALFLIGSYPYAIPRQPEIDYARSLLAGAYIRAGKPAEAVRIYEQPAAGECFPDRRLTILGQAWFSLGDLKKSGEYYRQSVQKYPRQPEGYLNYASVLSETGRPAEAVKVLESGLKLHPKGAVLADMEFNLGEIAQRCRQFAAAERHYRNALAVFPSHRRALNNLGTLHLMKREPEKAVPLFRKALLAAPGDIRLMVNLAASLAMSGREKDAEGIVLEVLKFSPDCVQAQQLLNALRSGK